jgi:hypothetical protein
VVRHSNYCCWASQFGYSAASVVRALCYQCSKTVVSFRNCLFYKQGGRDLSDSKGYWLYRTVESSRFHRRMEA